MARDYEQRCGLARGLDVLGERWTLLIVRELLFGPKRFTDLLEGLPGVPPSLLSARLKEMQTTGIVSKRVLPPPAASTVYELTAVGKELERILLALARWGAQFGRPPRQSDAARPEWTAFALRSLFRPEAAAGVDVTCELRLPDVTFRLTVNDGVLTIDTGSDSSPDLVIIGDLVTIMSALMGRLPTREAVRRGDLKIQGDRKVLDRFLDMFRLVEGGVTKRVSESQGAGQRT
ncbi:MAG: winged helix-turn-helix transcriptional regulator [Candidatus Methylomirabilaceae bacterium]